MSDIETELLVVPHTHWDREWYLTFQQFRMKLVDTVDAVLDTLESDPEFRFFMLDGQTIILEDYLEIRPENAARLRSLAESGRLLVGPWYLQPDEFLVSGESLIRNLQKGRAIARDYGGAMPVGYVPDTFGHIAQLPQLLRGFGIDNAVFWRGVGPEIKRDAFRWRAPDGSEVVVAWLCDDFGYANAALLPLDDEALAARVEVMAARMRPWADGRPTLLLMNGGDHQMPQSGLPHALAAANERLKAGNMRLRIATLPDYITTLRRTSEELPAYTGELRSSYRAHLLPGVCSTRMWLKQQNTAGEALLTRWTEPATCWAWLLGEPYPRSELELAWKFLMQNHPHDSICGCSIDQVHREMSTRFAQSRQIAAELSHRALQRMAARVEKGGLPEGVPVLVFNSSGGPRTELVRATVRTSHSPFQVVDGQQRRMPHQVIGRQGSELLNYAADKAIVAGMLGLVREGTALGYTLLDATVGDIDDGGVVPVDIVVSEHGIPDLPEVERFLDQIALLTADERVTTFQVTARDVPTTELLFLAQDVPSYGGKVFTVQADHSAESPVSSALQSGPTWLENDFLRVDVEPPNGAVTLLDKLNGTSYSGLNQFIDDGDVGDLYTYCPPALDTRIDAPVKPAAVELLEAGPARATLRIRQTYRLPQACSADRSARSSSQVECEIVSDISLSPASRRVEVQTELHNAARDHRLRVLFPVPFRAAAVDAEGAFAVIHRQVGRASGSDAAGWAEQPVNTQPQRRFADLSDGRFGLAVLNRGLPEYEVVHTPAGSALALTLLRATGWLSRGDLSTRQGHAGPSLSTPEAQEAGDHTFEYALLPHAGNWEADDALVLREAESYEAPMRAAVAESGAAGASLPESWSFLQVAPTSLAVSAIKRAVDGEALILRVYNPSDHEVSATISLASPFEEASIVDLSERASSADVSRPLSRVSSTEVRTSIRGGEIQTLRFKTAPLATDVRDDRSARERL